MLKTIFSFLKFILVFIPVYYGIYFLLFSFNNKKGEPYIKEIQNEIYYRKNLVGLTFENFQYDHRYDYLFIGSSHCYRTFSPAIFTSHGIDSYNLGSMSQSPVNSYCIMANIPLKPRHLLLEVYPQASNISGEESFFNMVSSIHNYPMLFDMAYRLNNLRCYNMLSIKPVIDHYNNHRQYDPVNFYKGYVETTDSASEKTTYNSYVLKDEMLSKQCSYIEKMIDFCRANEILISLVYVPVPPELKISREEEFINRINRICLNHTIQFYNYGRNHQLSSTNHFYDGDHLNKTGVELFNELLLVEMKKRNDL